MKRYLVIANETVGGDDLVDEVRRRSEQDVAAFHVVVPGGEDTQSRSSQDTSVAGGGPTGPLAFGDPKSGDPSTTSGATDAPPGGPTSGPSGRLAPSDEARVVLEQVLDRLHAVAEEVTGEVGPPDPIDAARDALDRARYDEVVLATPRAGASKLVGQDLPRRLEQAVDVPVTTVFGERSEPREAQ